MGPVSVLKERVLRGHSGSVRGVLHVSENAQTRPVRVKMYAGENDPVERRERGLSKRPTEDVIQSTGEEMILERREINPPRSRKDAQFREYRCR